MNEAAMVLIAVTVVTLMDMAVGWHFMRTPAHDVGAPAPSGTSNPAALRRVGRLLLIASPVIWIVVAAICFDLIPVGLGPVSFQ